MAANTASVNSHNRVKTNFEKVQEFNRAFDMAPQEPEYYCSYSEDYMGNIQYNPYKNIRMNLFTDSPKTVKLRLDLINEEIAELNAAISAVDSIETRDALADILYVVYGMADVLGIDIDSIFKNMIEDNMIQYSNAIQAVDKTIDTAFIQMAALIKYANSIDHTRYIGLTNYNWVQVQIDIYPSQFLEMKNYKELSSNDILPVIQNNINNQFELLTEFIMGLINSNHNLLSVESIEPCGIMITELLKWVYCYTVVGGINVDRDFAIVHDSNMSKLCCSEMEAAATVADYQAKFAAGSSPYDSPYYYYLPNLEKWIVKNRNTGKALKNINYRKVDFLANEIQSLKV
jgi:predicted HAD superfamily Cof-like phosphohydrolase